MGMINGLWTQEQIEAWKASRPTEEEYRATRERLEKLAAERAAAQQKAREAFDKKVEAFVQEVARTLRKAWRLVYLGWV